MSKSPKTRHRTQLFVAQRTRMTAAASVPAAREPTPPLEEEKPEPAPEQESHYDIHTRPTLPMSHYAALAKDLKPPNPFEREDTESREGTDEPAREGTAQIGRTATMLDDAQPLLVQDSPIAELSSWSITPMAKYPDHPVIAWICDDQLHVRDERTVHHAIGLSERRLTALHHDPHATWFATDQGRLFRFDRREKKLALASKMPQDDVIIMIQTSRQHDHLVLVSSEGKIYTSPKSSPGEITRAARSLPSGVLHGTYDPKHDELILVTTTSRILRVAMTPGMPPKGSSITCDGAVVALHFSPEDRLLHVQQADPDCVVTYKWGTKPRRMFAASLPDSHQGIYLNTHTQQVHLLVARGSVLLHTPLM